MSYKDPLTPGTKHRLKTIQEFERTIDQIFEPHLIYTAACSSSVVSVGQSIDEVATLLLGNQIKKLIDSIRQHLTREQVLGRLCTLPRSDAATDADINLLNIQTEQLLKLTQLPTSSALRQKLQTAITTVDEIKKMIASNPCQAYELLSQQAIAGSLHELHEAITVERKDFIRKFAVAVSQSEARFVYDNTPAILELSIKTAWDRYKTELGRPPTYEDMNTFLRENPDIFGVFLLAGRDFTPGHATYVNGLTRYEKYSKYLLQEYIDLFLEDIISKGEFEREYLGDDDVKTATWVKRFLHEIVRFITSAGVDQAYMCQLNWVLLNKIKEILKKKVAEMIERLPKKRSLESELHTEKRQKPDQGGGSHSRLKSKKARRYKKRTSIISKASRRYRRRTTKQKQTRLRTQNRSRTRTRTKNRKRN